MASYSGSGLTHLLITSIRNDIADDSTSPTYSDTQLNLFIGKAAALLNSRLYNIDASGNSFSTFNWSSGTATFSDTLNDIQFGLVLLQSECLIARRAYGSAIFKSIKVVDGDTSIDTSTSLNGHKDFIGNPKFGVCAQLENLILQYNRNNSGPELNGSIIYHGNSRTWEQHDHQDSYGNLDRHFEVLPDFDDILNW